ncbi:MAG: hypothetical protein LBO82_10630 [Synergistaceae bacterium]|nr:hypothetical protein [Synergistaceae bacterium]
MPERRTKRTPFLLLVVLFATVLLFLSFWIIRQNSSKPGGSLEIYHVTISTETDDRRRLTGVVSRFPYGARQVCLYFDYGKITRDSKVEILWSIGDKIVQSGSYVLSPPSGSRIYGLVLEDGRPLPKGPYSVRLIFGKDFFSDFRFEIY